MSPFSDPSLGDALNQAARDLPDGWQLVIEVENGTTEVVLFRPSGIEEMLPGSEDTAISDRVRAAVRLARK